MKARKTTDDADFIHCTRVVGINKSTSEYSRHVKIFHYM
jgi:uncharacterized C2H2 Zn-finger protein